MAQEHKVVAVVVTFNRKELLLRCLEALAAQTRAVDEVVLVDNGSTDGTFEALEDPDATRGLPIRLVRLMRNGGAAEGFHVGIAAALERESDWLWLMDDDCLPDHDALERLLDSAVAADPGTALLAPVVRSAAREVLPLNRGRVRRGWFVAPLAAVPAGEHAGDPVPIDFSTWVGMLVRTPAAREAGLPPRELFIRNEDVEWSLRVSALGRMWLVADSSIVHLEPAPFTDADTLRGRLREYLAVPALRDEWKNLSALRNLVWATRRHQLLSGPQTVSYVLVQALRRLLLSDRHLRAFGLTLLFARDGWRGVFRSVPPARWPDVVEAKRPVDALERHALRFDDVPPPRQHPTSSVR